MSLAISIFFLDPNRELCLCSFRKIPVERHTNISAEKIRNGKKIEHVLQSMRRIFFHSSVLFKSVATEVLDEKKKVDFRVKKKKQPHKNKHSRFNALFIAISYESLLFFFKA